MSEPREIIIGPGQEVVVKGAGDPLGQVLDAIVAEGHPYVYLRRNHLTEGWYCSSHIDDAEAPSIHDDYEGWRVAVHMGDKRGTAALEVAQKRLDQIRLGKSLTWLAFAAPEAP